MKNKIISGISTAVIMLLVAVVLIAFGYDPPIPENGVEVNLGDSDFGSGDDPKPASNSAAVAPAASQNHLASQNTEPTPSISANKNNGNTVAPNTPTQPVNEPKVEEVNKNALYPGKRNNGGGNGSQGVSTGTGDQGKPNGSINSNNYSGNGGGNGNYSLAGRTSVVLPTPDYRSNDQGTVVIRIWVNRDGKVTRTEYEPKGSNTSNGYLIEQARSAALKARFNPDQRAPEEQKGTITYIFKI